MECVHRRQRRGELKQNVFGIFEKDIHGDQKRRHQPVWRDPEKCETKDIPRLVTKMVVRVETA